MWTQSTRPASLCLERSPAAFDQIPAHIQRRDDLTSGAKRLYGLLASVQRMHAQPDYRWLATELAASVRSIVRWVQQLVGAGLIAVRKARSDISKAVAHSETRSSLITLFPRSYRS